MGVACESARPGDEPVAAEPITPIANCFGAGTPVATPEGEVPIERLAVGDEVLSLDHAGGRVQVGIVTAVTEHPDTRHGSLQLPHGGTLRVTFDHPIFLDGAYRPASEVRPGRGLCVLDGDSPAPTYASATDLFRPGMMGSTYDITVTPFSNFFAAGILVHNKPPCWGDGPNRCDGLPPDPRPDPEGGTPATVNGATASLPCGGRTPSPAPRDEDAGTADDAGLP
jgi:hypothetical protein